MLRYINYNIVFQEIPGEVTLAVNLSNCPNRCKGCHSPHLQEDAGKELTESVLSSLLEKYGEAVTCICFMGGDASPEEVLRLAAFVRAASQQRQTHKTAWYSGKSELYGNATNYFDYIKLGEYMENLGGLDSPITNQRFYRVENGEMTDKTIEFHKHK